ncbi:uncharacterized protein [Palaemon carinicauda]|uniref:uncharacterized protein n=1 Tax=Palaemon carinicauda TaxID=392227 RepID=UPI0035B668F2
MKVMKMVLGQYCSRCYGRKKGTMRTLETLGIFLVVAVTVFLVYQYTATRSRMVISVEELQTMKEKYSAWPTFNIKLIHNRDWYIDNCFNSQFSEDLEDVFRNLIPIWSETENDECKILYEKFIALYEVHERYSGKLTLPSPFLKRVFKWLGGDKTLLEQVHQQHLIHIFHPLTAEHTVYNPVRSKRPMPTKDTNIFEWVNKLSAETEKDCDFCNFMNMTAVDEFGSLLSSILLFNLSTLLHTTTTGSYQSCKWRFCIRKIAHYCASNICLELSYTSDSKAYDVMNRMSPGFLLVNKPLNPDCSDLSFSY